jgi:hypothetical protein
LGTEGVLIVMTFTHHHLSLTSPLSPSPTHQEFSLSCFHHHDLITSTLPSHIIVSHTHTPPLHTPSIAPCGEFRATWRRFNMFVDGKSFVFRNWTKPFVAFVFRSSSCGCKFLEFT